MLAVGCPGAVADEYCLLQGADFRGYVGEDDFFGNGGLACQLVRMCPSAPSGTARVGNFEVENRPQFRRAGNRL